jgi:hypothetical protein
LRALPEDQVGDRAGPLAACGARGKRPHFSDLLTIGLVGAAATAVFARNVIGLAKDWIELTKNTQRSIKVTIGDKVVEIKQGDDISDLLQKYFPDDGTSNPL